MDRTDDGAGWLPEGWTLCETDGAGARYVAVFRVEGILAVEDGELVLKALDESRRRDASSNQFGAGYAGLKLLAEFQPDYLKIDLGLIRGLADAPVRPAIVDSIVAFSNPLGEVMIAEGVEMASEPCTLGDLGIALLQGYLFARPAVAALPPVSYASVDRGIEDEAVVAYAD